MITRSRVFFTLSLVIGLFVTSKGVAETRESSGYAVSARSRVELDREFESAMHAMDRNLAALLGSRTMDCVDGDLISGEETCWVSLDSEQEAVASRGPVAH